ncbi:MAG: type II toxin-antitoxin system RelE/ParE family toxin [Chitinophagaceae bacterium]|nr:type II toxin-antitoxin system RelE/ParE family toxin [Chitinophagaceae bacterium]
MERRIITTPIFRRKVEKISRYTGKEFGNKAVIEFITKLDSRLNLLLKYPDSGRPLLNRANVKSFLLTPHNKIYYKIYPSRITVPDLIDMRENPDKNPFA